MSARFFTEPEYLTLLNLPIAVLVAKYKIVYPLEHALQDFAAPTGSILGGLNGVAGGEESDPDTL